jgi:ribose transport system substrate-binding protein
MGKVALQVALDVLNGLFPGGWVATPTITTDINNVFGFLCKPDELDPKPSKEYPCTKP